MQRNSRNIFFVLLTLSCIFFILPSCRVAKNLPEGETLLVKNKFVIHTKVKVADREKIRLDVPKIVAQKPNKRVFNFAPVRMWMYYQAAHSKKLTKFKQWVIDKVGEAPVVYDSTLIKKSLDQIETYLFYAGYFHASVTDTVITKKKKTSVIYNIKTEAPFLIGDVELPKGHTPCDSIVREKWKGSLLKKGQRFDIANLKGERDRIETLLKNSGYFLFNREYITFGFDTTSAEQTVNVKIYLNHPNDSSEHQQFYINNIYVITDFTAENIADSTNRDTLESFRKKRISGKVF
jgi:hypothetical protein